jgi:hypothetical protein
MKSVRQTLVDGTVLFDSALVEELCNFGLRKTRFAEKRA